MIIQLINAVFLAITTKDQIDEAVRSMNLRKELTAHDVCFIFSLRFLLAITYCSML